MGKKLRAFFSVFLAILVLSVPAISWAEDGYVVNDAYPDKKISFDPTKVEVDDGWEEIFSDKGDRSLWCNDETVIYEHMHKVTVLDVATKTKRRLVILPKKPRTYSWDYLGCSPSGRYLFTFRTWKIPTKRGDYQRILSALDVFDMKTLKRVQSVPVSENYCKRFYLGNYGFWPTLSPDGKKIAWYTEGELALDESHKITLVPAYRFEGVEFLEPKATVKAWSADSRKVYMLNKDRRLIEYNLEGGKYKYSTLELPPNAWLPSLKFTEKGDKAFLLAVLGDFDSLFEIDLDSLNFTQEKITPKLIRKGIIVSSIKKDAEIVYLVTSTPGHHEYSSEKLSGIFIGDLYGKVIKRIKPADAFYQTTKLSKDGTMILYEKMPFDAHTRPAYSEANRQVIPTETDTPFRAKPTPDSD